MNGYLTPTIDDVFQFHEKTHCTIDNQLQQEKVAAAPQPGAVFFGMTSDEVDDFFRRLDQLAMFDLLSTTEAHLRADFQNRVQMAACRFAVGIFWPILLNSGRAFYRLPDW